MRYAELPDASGVVVTYVHHYDTGIVDLLYVGS